MANVEENMYPVRMVRTGKTLWGIKVSHVTQRSSVNLGETIETTSRHGISALQKGRAEWNTEQIKEDGNGL